MSTPAFEAFLEQFHSKGRLHAEGYMAAHFAGLTDVEQDQAEAMLVQAALGGDGTAIAGLNLLGGDRANRALSKVEQGVERLSTVGVQAAAALLALRKDANNLQKLLSAIESSDPQVSWLALRVFPGTIAFERQERLAIARVLGKVVLNEPDMVRRHMAAKTLLQALGVNEGKGEYAELVRQLSGDSRAVRDSALQKLIGP
jgi:hypothetical protein